MNLSSYAAKLGGALRAALVLAQTECMTIPTMDQANHNKMGDEVRFTRHFYKPKPLRTLAEIGWAQIEAR